jgi:BirA family transcriptional regulator, biotin operon repressor / biotin---[acetyl-CoA-carboxylase] ligase
MAIIGSKIYQTETCNNSLKWAKKFLQKAPDGAIFLANKLSFARGRQKRVWSVFAGQLMVTILLKPENLKKEENLSLHLNWLNMALSLGILEPIKKYGVKLKWPNDFIAQDKKLGGMLMELVWQEARPKGIILGFALNINNIFVPQDSLFPIATSLTMLTKKFVDKENLFQQIISTLDLWYQLWMKKKFDKIYEEWKEQQLYQGQVISVHHKDGTVVSGVVHKFCNNGDIILETSFGNNKKIPFYIVEEIRSI